MALTDTQASASRVSLLTIGQQAIMDAYLCLLHLTTGIMIEPLFSSFSTAAGLEFIIFAIFEMRYLLSIWRARRQAVADPWSTQHELSVLYARFYGALLCGIFLAYQFQRFGHVLVFVAFSFWVPQIIYCAATDSRQPLSALYMWGMSLTRLALPLYLLTCPHNLLRIEPRPVCVLLIQTRQGPRCFVPTRFLPEKYDYHRAVTSGQVRGARRGGDIETGDGGVECVICMSMLDVTQAGARMVTPCNHFFHTTCLQRWLGVKLQCPTCRSLLPPP
eukprot:jgi/Astpho2/6624/fgenesh1_pm.00101_%23_14_t